MQMKIFHGSKKQLLYLAFIISLFVGIIGISYSAYFFVGTGTKENSIVTGQIVVNFNEENNIKLTNRYPETDTEGIANIDSKSISTFTVSSNIIGNTTVNYAIGLTSITEGATLKSDYVKIYMTKNRKVVNGFSEGIGRTIDSFKNNYITGYIDSHVITTGTLQKKQVDTYSIKAWISENYLLPAEENSSGGIHTKTSISESFSFKIKVVAIDGELKVEKKLTGIYIDKIINKRLSNGGEEESIPNYYNTEAHFEIKTTKNTSTIEYDVVIKNDSEEVKVLNNIETLLNSNDSSIAYEVTGFKIGDTITPGEAKISHVKIYVKNVPTASENQITSLNILFNFGALSWKPLEVEFLSESDQGDLATNKDGVTFKVKVTNPNPVSVNYYMTFNNTRFTLKDYATGKKEYKLEANKSVTNTILVTLRQDITYEKLEEKILLILKATYPVSENIDIRTLTLKLPNNLKSIVLNSRTIQKAPESFTGIEDTNGYLFKTNEVDESSYTYYYRGVIDNNYVSFAGKLWRIVRIDSTGNVRIVLNDNASTKAKYSNNYNGDIASIEDAINMLNYKNSDIRKVVELWYDNNIKTHDDSKHVVDSNFCVDMSYQGPITTQYNKTVYYFTPYVHVGIDTNNFNADFACNDENIFTSHVGLLSAEEVFAAGGYWQTVNNKYYLYNQDLPEETAQTSWTLSSSYYSISEKQAGVIVFNQRDDSYSGSLFDYTWGSNLSQDYGYRPVISLDGNAKAIGNGTKENPFELID